MKTDESKAKGSTVSVVSMITVKCCIHADTSTPSRTCDPTAEFTQHVLHCCRGQLRAPWWWYALLCLWSPGHGLCHNLLESLNIPHSGLSLCFPPYPTCLKNQNTLCQHWSNSRISAQVGAGIFKGIPACSLQRIAVKENIQHQRIYRWHKS